MPRVYTYTVNRYLNIFWLNWTPIELRLQSLQSWPWIWLVGSPPGYDEGNVILGSWKTIGKPFVPKPRHFHVDSPNGYPLLVLVPLGQDRARCNGHQGSWICRCDFFCSSILAMVRWLLCRVWKRLGIHIDFFRTMWNAVLFCHPEM